MQHTMSRCSYLALFTALAFSSSQTMAQESATHTGKKAAQDTFTPSGSVGLKSDYRRLGIADEDEEITLNATLKIKHKSGFYAQNGLATLTGLGRAGSDASGLLEVSPVVGWTRKISSFTLDSHLVWYFYPGARNTDHPELVASVARSLGPVATSIQFTYVPESRNVARANRHIYGEGTLPILNIDQRPLKIIGGVGYSNGGGSPTGSYVHYKAGGQYDLGNHVTLAAWYERTKLTGDEPLAGNYTLSQILAQLSLAF